MARRNGVRSQRREKTWTGGVIPRLGPTSAATLTTGQSEVLAVVFPTAGSTLEDTARSLLRIRGRVSLQALGSTDGHVLASLGIIVIERDNVPPTGAGATFGPVGAPDAPWIWVGQTVGQGATATSRLDAINGTGALEIDAQAMRRLKASQSVAFILEVTNLGVTGQTIQAFVSGFSRELYAE